MIQGEINNAVRQLTSARTCSVEAMGAVRTSPLPHAASTAGQPCAPAEGKMKGEESPYTWQGSDPAVQSCAPAVGSAGGLLMREEPYGSQNVRHTISERTLSEIARILKAAWRSGSNVAMPSFGVMRYRRREWQLAVGLLSFELLRISSTRVATRSELAQFLNPCEYR